MKHRIRYKELFSDTLAFMLSNFASKILVFLLIPLYTSFLTTEEYGIADLIINTINVIYPILTLSIMEATLRFTMDRDINKEEVLVNSLYVVFVSEIFVVIVTPFIKFISIELSEYWIWFLLIYGIENVRVVFSQYIKGIGKTRVFAVSGIIQTISIIISNIVFVAILKFTIYGYMLSIVISSFITCIYLIMFVDIKISLRCINKQLLKSMLEFSIPTIPTMVAWWVNTSADKYIIIAYLSVAASGLYSVAYKIPSILTMFSNIFTSAWTLSAIKNVDAEDSLIFQKKIYQYFNLVNTLVCSLLILLSKFLCEILFAEDFFLAWKYVPILLVAYVFSGLSGFMASSFRATKKVKSLFSSTVAGAIINITLNFYFVKKFGNIGAAVTTMISFATIFYMRSSSLKKIIGIKIELLRDTIVYLFLIIEAFFIIAEIKGSYVVGVIIIMIIMYLYKELIFNAIKTINSEFKRIKGEK